MTHSEAKLTPTEGSRQFARRLDADGPNRARELAWVLQVSEQTILGWKMGRRRPEAHYRAAMELLLGIPQDAWFSDEEQALLKRVHDYLEHGVRGLAEVGSDPPEARATG